MHVEGKIKEIIAEEGVIIESDVLIYKILGWRRVKKHKILVSNRNDEIPIEKLDSSLEGKIIVGGSFISLEAYKKSFRAKNCWYHCWGF